MNSRLGERPTALLCEQQLRDDVTLIIPTFCCEPYLSAAIGSALNCPARLILIADDASVDGTVDVAARWAVRYPERIRILTSPVNRGAAKTINSAVQHVATPYFARLDGDDVLLPGALESGLAIISEYPALALVCGHDIRINASDVLEFDAALVRPTDTAAPVRIMSHGEAFRFILEWNPNASASGALFRTEAFREAGGLDETIVWGEDWEIWLRLARHWAVAYRDAPSALYRRHDNSTTQREARNNRVCYGYDAVYRRAAELCPDPSLRPLLRQKFLRTARIYVGASRRMLWEHRSIAGAFERLARATRAFASALRL